MRRALVGMLVLPLVAACGSSGDTKEASTATTRADVVADVSTTTSKGVEEVTSTVPAAGGTAPTSTTVAAAAAAAAASDATGPTGLTPGTYRYRQSGSTTAGAQRYDAPPEGTMVVKAPDGDGKQLLQRYIDPKGDPSDVVMQFRPDGMFMLETVLRQGGQEVRCSFGGGVPSPSWPPTVGAKTSGHGTCNAYDLQVDITSTITGTKPVTVDGAAYTAYVVESIVKTTGQLTSETTQVDWFVGELRLATHTETSSKGSFGTFEFSSTGTSDLVSAKPE